jgi:hypothetical protein
MEVIMLKKRDSDFDRRSANDRRIIHDLDYFITGGPERRSQKERRLKAERRSGWMKISKYSSVFIMGTENITLSPEIHGNITPSI